MRPVGPPSWQNKALFPLTAHHKRLAEWAVKRRHKPDMTPDGRITIGVGRDLTVSGLNDEEIDVLLHNDLAAARKHLLETYPWTLRLDPCRFAALQELCMRMGSTTLRAHPAVLMALEHDDFVTAGERLSTAAWCLRRPTICAPLIGMLLTGEWPWEGQTLASPEPYPLTSFREP